MITYTNYTLLHSITLFCTDLGLIGMLLTNQNAEIVACILLQTELDFTRPITITNYY